MVLKLDTTLEYRSLSPFWGMTEKMFCPRSINTTYFSIPMLKFRGSWGGESKIIMSWVKSINKPDKRKSVSICCVVVLSSLCSTSLKCDIILIGNCGGFTSYWYKNLDNKTEKNKQTMNLEITITRMSNFITYEGLLFNVKTVTLCLFAYTTRWFPVKNLPQCGRPGFNPWFRKIPWRWGWQPTPVFLPGESHG